MTLQEQICRGLTRLGYRADPAGQRATARYVVYHALLRSTHRVYVGTMGALRVGSNVTSSVPLDGPKAKALTAGLPSDESWAALKRVAP